MSVYLLFLVSFSFFQAIHSFKDVLTNFSKHLKIDNVSYLDIDCKYHFEHHQILCMTSNKDSPHVIDLYNKLIFGKQYVKKKE